MMDDYDLSFWIYLAVVTALVGGGIKKILASHLSTGPTLVAWLGATVLVERLWAFCLPAMLLLVLLALICYIYLRSRAGPPPTLPMQGKAVFITGCDTGFGNAAAKRLDSLGIDVFATVLDLTGEGARELQKSCSSRLTLLQVDITKPQQVQQALLDTKAKLGLRGLWGLVNNAGVCVNLGDAELSLMSNFRGCMEVNFFGTVSITQSFLPLLRQSKGRIVNISSPAGDQPFPCLAAYGSSKAALNLFTESLRHELQPWGVKVSIILPSSYRTAPSSNNNYWEQKHKQLLESMSPALVEEYGEDYMNETINLFRSFGKNANPDFSPVLDAIVQALFSPEPQARYYAGPGLFLMYFVNNYCPLSIRNRFLQKIFLKKTLMPRALREQSGQEVNRDLHNNNNEEKLQQL
ncbi:11-beta-hydroxysteroid dehydrogenase type 2 [Girardinichthys multiradiatus]|uniref:11-beta-hydroxysteroid dehydrogenase type 2 n=1 Tax=Girardinichthys multiradiatus TaxID=208333 RepID=UPI001FAD3F80|nr:11-beta-hydroxysteroid dehydrogenase type 2 [Girardinichthys multiradiatus]